jgi:hypothetical protein
VGNVVVGKVNLRNVVVRVVKVFVTVGGNTQGGTAGGA